MWRLLHRSEDDLIRDIIEYDGENFGDLGVHGMKICTGVL